VSPVLLTNFWWGILSIEDLKVLKKKLYPPETKEGQKFLAYFSNKTDS